MNMFPGIILTIFLLIIKTTIKFRINFVVNQKYDYCINSFCRFKKILIVYTGDLFEHQPLNPVPLIDLSSLRV